MEFKKFSAGAISYGIDKPDLDPIQLKKEGITNVNFKDDSLKEHMAPHHINSGYISTLMEILAVCHTIIVEKKEDEVVYNASSPDELALVNAAKFLGYDFKGRDEDNNVVIDINGKERKYKLLNVIEFTSTRKRMTVIVKT
jgi:phospholipid-transporting ATPase